MLSHNLIIKRFFLCVCVCFRTHHDSLGSVSVFSSTGVSFSLTNLTNRGTAEMESKNNKVSNDEEAYFEDILEKRFGMSSNEAMKRLYYVLMLITAGTLIWVLTAVELLLVLTFDDSHKVCVL